MVQKEVLVPRHESDNLLGILVTEPLFLVQIHHLIELTYGYNNGSEDE